MAKPWSLNGRYEEIAQRIANGETGAAIALELGVSRQAINSMLRRRNPTAGKRFLSPRSLTDLTPAQAAYIAGITDGDGWISRDAGTDGWRVGITNTKEELIRWLQQFGGKCYRHRPVAKTFPNGTHRAAMWVWQVSRQADVWALLVAIEPYLILKKQKARLGIYELVSRYYFS